MPSNKHVIAVRTDDITYNTICDIANKENRSLSNLCEYLLKEYIRNYEAEGGAVLSSSNGVSSTQSSKP
jgi:hypothetical protein